MIFKTEIFFLKFFLNTPKRNNQIMCMVDLGEINFQIRKVFKRKAREMEEEPGQRLACGNGMTVKVPVLG